MKYKIWKLIFILCLSCADNDHFRGKSDYHFWAKQHPKLKIELTKASKNGLYVQQVVMHTGSDDINYQAQNDKKCYFECSLDSNDDDSANQSFSKKITILTSDNEEYSIEITFLRQYQLINDKNGIGKVYHLHTVTTDIPDAEIKTDYKNKILYNTYVGENTLEIEY